MTNKPTANPTAQRVVDYGCNSLKHLLTEGHQAGTAPMLSDIFPTSLLAVEVHPERPIALIGNKIPLLPAAWDTIIKAIASMIFNSNLYVNPVKMTFSPATIETKKCKSIKRPTLEKVLISEAI